jgi:hypothetical protein
MYTALGLSQGSSRHANSKTTWPVVRPKSRIEPTPDCLSGWTMSPMRVRYARHGFGDSDGRHDLVGWRSLEAARRWKIFLRESPLASAIPLRPAYCGASARLRGAVTWSQRNTPSKLREAFPSRVACRQLDLALIDAWCRSLVHTKSRLLGSPQA